MKVYCKKTYSELNRNFYTIGPAGYGQYWNRWIEGNFYFTHEPNPFEKRAGIYLWITSENPNNPEQSVRGPIRQDLFKKHFLSLEEWRNVLIEEICN
jgi:hypothetical protein